MPEPPAPAAGNAGRQLWALALTGVGLGLCVVAFNLLYLSVPAGWTPPYGFAPGVGAAFSPVWPTPRLALAPGTFRALALGLEGGLWATYLVALALAARLDGAPPSRGRALRVVAVGGTVIAVALILTPPALSKDLYHYAVFGKMLVARGLNPYANPIDALAGDPLSPLANWGELSTHYGPVFTALSALAVLVGGGGAVGTALAFKTLATAFGAAAAWAVYRMAVEEGRSGLVPLLLVAWNPLVLLETAGSGHNEMVMLGPALVGLYAMRSGRVGFGFALLVLSVNVKWVTAALAALAAIEHLRDAAGHRARALGWLAALAGGLTLAFYAPFWTGLDGLHVTRQLVSGAPIAHSAMSGVPARLPSVLAFAAIGIVAAVVVWRSRPSRVLEMAAIVSLAFVVLVFPWLFPWYLIPALVLLAAAPPTRTNRAVLLAITLLAVTLMLPWAALVPGRSG